LHLSGKDKEIISKADFDSLKWLTSFDRQYENQEK
jgi:hypothetical protein